MSILAIIVTATCYHAVAGQCNEDYLRTAGGYEICSTDSAYSHRYMAVSRDMLKEFPYGTLVEVTECPIDEYRGAWLVVDCMNRRYTNTVDFLVNPGMPLMKEDIEIIKRK